MTAPYSHTYYSESHHMLEDFPTLLPQSSCQLAEQPLQQAKAVQSPSPGKAKGIFSKPQLNKLGQNQTASKQPRWPQPGEQKKAFEENNVLDTLKTNGFKAEVSLGLNTAIFEVGQLYRTYDFPINTNLKEDQHLSGSRQSIRDRNLIAYKSV